MEGVKKSTTKAMSFKKEIAERLELEAKRENRSISNYVETILIKHFENNGGQLIPSR